MSTLGGIPPGPSGEESSRERPALRRVRTAMVETAAAAVVGRSPRVGYVAARANAVRDGVAVALLSLALLLPWNLDFGVGSPSATAYCSPSSSPSRCSPSSPRSRHTSARSAHRLRQDVRRTSRIRLLLSVAYLIIAIGFAAYQLLETWRNGGTGLVPPGIGPGLLLGVGGALLASQPPITSITIQDNGFRRWYAARGCWVRYRSRSRRWRSPSTCTGGCATCSSPTAPSTARTSPSSSPRCCTARRR